eukprot:gene8662-6088_t
MSGSGTQRACHQSLPRVFLVGLATIGLSKSTEEVPLLIVERLPLSLSLLFLSSSLLSRFVAPNLSIYDLPLGDDREHWINYQRVTLK